MTYSYQSASVSPKGRKDFNFDIFTLTLIATMNTPTPAPFPFIRFNQKLQIFRRNSQFFGFKKVL